MYNRIINGDDKYYSLYVQNNTQGFIAGTRKVSVVIIVLHACNLNTYIV